MYAARGVDLTLEAGETLGMAGESGSGKTTVAMSLLRLLPAQTDGDGRDPLPRRGPAAGQLGPDARGPLGRGVGGVPGSDERPQPGQDDRRPDRRADPCSTRRWARRSRGGGLAILLDSVGVPSRRVTSYPHELSGGQRQRVMMAMALACDPHLVIADEPTTALDVIVQAQILTLLTDLVRERGISLIMISHDLSVLASDLRPDRGDVRRPAGRDRPVAGRSSPSRSTRTHVRSPVPSRPSVTRGRGAHPSGLAGDPPDLREEIDGCPFARRCPEVEDRCRHGPDPVGGAGRPGGGVRARPRLRPGGGSWLSRRSRVRRSSRRATCPCPSRRVAGRGRREPSTASTWRSPAARCSP